MGLFELKNLGFVEFCLWQLLLSRYDWEGKKLSNGNSEEIDSSKYAAIIWNRKILHIYHTVMTLYLGFRVCITTEMDFEIPEIIKLS